jgi:hypothetical protein
VPQSVVHVAQLSRAVSQNPSPHVEQEPQSAAHDAQDSPALALHDPSPQRGQLVPQSPGQLVQLSAPLQMPSPHAAHAPQSPGQLPQVSLRQIPSPQTGGPQSPGQVVAVSVPSHHPSPHTV